jgi:integrase/recombinase XerD
MTNVKIATILDTRRKKETTLYPVKLRVTFERIQRYYPLPSTFDLKKEEFEKVMFGKRLTENEKNLKKNITAFENKAIEIVKALPEFTWLKFKKYYYINRGTKDTLNTAFENYSTQLRETGRIGTAVSYECAKKSLNDFTEGLKFADVTPEFLNKYEKWMLTNGKSITTVGIYLRSLRTLFNNAKSEGVMSNEFYPFGKKKYEIPTGKNIKKALTLHEIAKIYHYQTKAGTTEAMAKDYWIFIYLCNGLNVKDLCLLKRKNIDDNILKYERSKTMRSKKISEKIVVSLKPDALATIKNWGIPSINPETYVFPHLEKGMTAENERKIIQQLTKTINKYMKRIAKELEINKEVTTYFARHSFATVLRNSGVSIEFISEALGHSNMKTTQSYLAGFETDQIHATTNALTAFLK